MSTNIKMPSIDIVFKGLGATAMQRSIGGRIAVLIVKDDTDNTFTFAEYISLEDLTTAEIAKYTLENLEYIKDALEGGPKRVIVARMDVNGVLIDLLAKIKGKVEMNCWIAMADATNTETNDLVSFVKTNVKNNKKRYKAIVYDATISDDMSIVNLTNTKVTFKDKRKEQTADKAVPYILGYLAGLSLDMSSIAKPLQKFDRVVEPEDLDTAISNGEFVLYNDEGEVRVARGVNSLVTLGQGITQDMCFILITEVMDMIYTDIYKTWNNFYKGRYKNSLDNQMLLIGAINSYFEAIANDMLLDPNFDNRAMVDIITQRLENIPKYGKEEVDTWDDNKVMEMTVGTNIYLVGNIKILNAMEDLRFIISM